MSIRNFANRRSVPPTEAQDLFGGKGVFRRSAYYSDQDNLAPFTIVVETEMAPGAFAGIHSQPDQHELLYILEGAGTFTVDGNTYEVSQGDALMASAGAKFALANPGQSPLRYLAVKCRAGK